MAEGPAIEGVDYSWGRPDPAALVKAGKKFVIRYLSYDRTGKNLSEKEAKALQAAGLSIVSNWEWDSRDQLGGYARGVEHAKEADRQHRACGGPADRPIYFSTDFDASTSQLAICYEYLRGAASVIGWKRVGVYGGRRTVEYMRARGVQWLWQTYAWSSGVWVPGVHIQQYRNGVKLAGADVDLDRALAADFGQWGQQNHDQEEDMPLSDADVKKIRDAIWGMTHDKLSPDRDTYWYQRLTYKVAEDARDRIKSLAAELAKHDKRVTDKLAEIATLVAQAGTVPAEQIVDEIARRLAEAG